MTPERGKGLGIDSSLFLSSENELSPLEYREKLIFILQPILAERFPNDPPKQRIKTHINRLSIACPYCGDSMKNPHAKRGNIILAGKFANTYKCFNCDQFRNLDRFIKDFKGSLDLDVIDYISKTKVDFENFIHKKYDVSFLLDRETIEGYALTRDEVKAKLQLQEVDQFSVWNWLKHRQQFQKERFLYSPGHNYLVVLNLVDKDKIIGLQRRMFKGNNKYLTYKLSKLYELFRPGVEVPDEVDAVSTLFGIMELNFAKPITLFEGPLDSFLFKNSVASGGASKSFPIDLPLRYFYDKDKKGVEKSIEKLNNGMPVFLWDKFLRDLNAPSRKKWDLNDIIIWAWKNKVKLPNYDMYFSDDELDIIDI